MNPLDLNVNWPLLLAALLPWASLMAAALFTPRLSRPDLFFAVTVSPAFRTSAEGRKILRGYDRAVVLVAILALQMVGFIQFGTNRLVLVGLLGPIVLEMAGWFAAFLSARRRAMRFHVEPTQIREAVLEHRHLALPGGCLAQLGPFLILGAMMLGIWWRWGAIPARIPVHWGASGLPDGWAARSPISVFGGGAIGMLACSLLAWLWLTTLRGVRRIHCTGACAATETRYIRAISFLILGIEYWIALLMGLLSLAALRPHPEAPLPAFFPILLIQTALIAAVFCLAYRTGQGGWRLQAPGKSEPAVAVPVPTPAPIGDRTPDASWKLGIFYVNRNDPALFVEKRFGIGWTLNFANPRALLVLGGIVLFLGAAIGISLAITH